jgi:acetyl-CoA C-acetyltransferase
MQAIVTAAQSIMLGEYDAAVAGGIESMSRMPYLIDAEDARWGHKMGNFTLVDAMYRDGFTCSLSGMIMGETVELLARSTACAARKPRPTRSRRQRRAGAAQASGRFGTRSRPSPSRTAKGRETTIEADEHLAPGHDHRVAAQAAAGLQGVDGRQGPSPPARRRGSPTPAPRWW